MPNWFDRVRTAVVIFISVGVTLFPGALAAQEDRPVVVGIPDSMPFAGVAEERAHGLIARAVLLALKRMNLKTTFRIVPYSRLYKWIGDGKLDVAVAVLNSKERAKKAHYSNPIAREYTILVVPKGRSFRFNRAEDLLGRRIGAQLGFLYPGLDHLSLDLARERNYRASIPKVLDGRLAATLVGSVTGLYDVAKMGAQNKIATLPNASEMIELGAAFSKKRFSPSDVLIFDQFINFIQAGPFWSRILEESGAAPYIRDWPIIPR